MVSRGLRIMFSFLCFCLVASVASGEVARTLVFDFENDMEGWLSYRGSWHWSDRDSLVNTLPVNSIDDGFAIVDTVGSDELYTPYVNATNGATVTLTFFLRSRWEGSNSMYINMQERGQNMELFLDLNDYSSHFSSSWIVVTGEIPPSEKEVMLSVFCYNGDIAPAESLMYGCAIDQIHIDIHGEETTPVTSTIATTTAETTAEPTGAPETTAAPTEAPETTAAPTEAPETTAAPTEAPETTAAPTEAPETTAEPTEAPETTAEATEAPETTAEPTEAPETTAEPTEAPETTAEPTEAPETTAAPTEAPETTAEPTEAPETTAEPTEAPETTAEPTEAPETTAAPTEAPETTAAPTEAPETTAAPTEAPETTAEPTEAPETTAAPTEAPETTTEGPSGILEYDFQSGAQGWTLSQMNGAAWKRVQFERNVHPVSPPPVGPWVLQVFPEHIFAGTALAQSPKLRAIGSSLTIDLTFWMDGTADLPAQLKARRRAGFSTFDVEPIMNLDPYGDQINYYWVVFRASLHDLVPGETFTITLEGSLGGNSNNSVAVNKVLLNGVEEIPTDTTDFIDFEDGLFGWSAGNMDGGRWVLKCWSDLDPSLNVPQPSDGKNFLFVDRFDIHSGVISLESPAFRVSAGQRKKVVVKFWLRGSVVYPAALRIRKKTVNGDYDDLPFLNLAQYGDIDNPDWILLDREYEIPVDETEDAFQLVIEADLGSDVNNMVALDDLKIITSYITP
ncbi:uncharacterized protein LOC122245198 [Penaeus japonicus]|uniref:uncharacterized protein LOC122245198 n=1 Tax=Penaeus japonicus TaxID=27405 RepID=UPI001C71747B|nr:uncharacterized protein LOC122245198 [Penaeus japonicus]